MADTPAMKAAKEIDGHYMILAHKQKTCEQIRLEIAAIIEKHLPPNAEEAVRPSAPRIKSWIEPLIWKVAGELSGLQWTQPQIADAIALSVREKIK